MKTFVVMHLMNTQEALHPSDWLDRCSGRMPAAPRAAEKTYGFTSPSCYDMPLAREECVSPTGNVRVGFTVLSKKVPGGKLKSTIAKVIREQEIAAGGKLSRKRKAEIKAEMKEAFLEDSPVDCKIHDVYRGCDDVALYFGASSDNLVGAFCAHVHDATSERYGVVSFDRAVESFGVSRKEEEGAGALAADLDASLGSAFLLYLLQRAYAGSTSSSQNDAPLVFAVHGDVTVADKTGGHGAELVSFQKGVPTAGEDFRKALQTKLPVDLGLIVSFLGEEYSFQLSSDCVFSSFKKNSPADKAADLTDEAVSAMRAAVQVVRCLFGDFCRDATASRKSVLQNIRAMRSGNG